MRRATGHCRISSMLPGQNAAAKNGASVSNAASTIAGCDSSCRFIGQLPQVVVRVQISPPHPARRRHFEEDRVRQTGLRQSIAEPGQGREQRSKILVENSRKRTPFVLV